MKLTYPTPSREELANRLQQIAWQMQNGCGNHGCVVKQPKGQGTNGPCTCRPRAIVDRILFVAGEVDKHATRWLPKEAA